MDTKELRTYFPQLNTQVYGHKLVYLDNAATSLRPISVIDKWSQISSTQTANLHRAVHHIAAIATAEYESTRDYIAKRLNVEREEIVFTSGATASLNLLAHSLSDLIIKPGDEIIISEAEHHSNIVPWQIACKKHSANIKILELDEDGRVNLDKLKSILSGKSKILCISHISNVLGLINPIKEITEICHSKDCLVVVDGAQGIVHTRPDLRELDCDFYVFSGHKVYASPGTGVLYGRKELLDSMPPFMGGGEMIESVSWVETKFAPVPQKFEAGTQNISGTPTLIPAFEIADKMYSFEIETSYKDLQKYTIEELCKIQGLKLYGTPSDISSKIPLFSFTVEHCHHEDMALIMDKMGFALRSGKMCADPLMDKYRVSGMLRASFSPYNTMEEAEQFIKALRKVIQILQ